MIVAIHQPNYLPWLGYFGKMAQADVFVLLDDVQYSKGSYTNRVQIDRGGTPVWLTVPVRHQFGATIRQVEVARPDWSRAHREILKQTYSRADAFKDVWREIEAWLGDAPGGLAEVNQRLITQIAARLRLQCRLLRSSDLEIQCDSADERLARIVASLAPGGTYLSGAGGAKYQSEATFAAHGIALAYSSYKPAAYARSGADPMPGLSIVDALFHLGFDRTAALVQGS